MGIPIKPKLTPAKRRSSLKKVEKWSQIMLFFFLSQLSNMQRPLWFRVCTFMCLMKCFIKCFKRLISNSVSAPHGENKNQPKKPKPNKNSDDDDGERLRHANLPARAKSLSCCSDSRFSQVGTLSSLISFAKANRAAACRCHADTHRHKRAHA